MFNSSTFISSSLLLIRNLLETNITDPISSSRNLARARFVMTGYPDRPVMYPIITVKSVGPTTNKKMGIGSQLEWTNLSFEIRVWAKDNKTRDNLAEQVYNYLRGNQLTGSNTNSEGLFGFKVISNIPVEEEGVNGIKSQIMNVNYNVVLGS